MLYCPWDAAKFFIFSSNVPSILYYALIPGILISIFLSSFVLLKNKESLAAKLLFFMSLLFAIWGIFDLILFATNNPREVMIFWSLTILVEVMMYATGLYLTYIFIDQRDISFIKKIIILCILLPFLILAPWKQNLIGVIVADCTAIEGVLALYFSYVVEILFVLWIIILGIVKAKKTSGETRKKIILFTIGIVLFLSAFSSGNIIGSFTSDWISSQYGYFGMPVFMAFLVYLIVKYRAFNIRLLGAQVLVIAIIILTGSQFFFIQNPTNRILTIISLALITFFGWFLVKSVARETRQKEQLTQYSKELATANFELQDAYTKLETLDKAKSEFVSIASHQLRTPLTAIKGYVSLMIEGDYGKLPKGALQSMKNVYLANERLVKLVNSLLDMSRLEAGKLTLDFSPVKIDDLVADILRELRGEAENKNLKLRLDKDRTTLPKIEADGTKLRDALMNLVDNAIKYTNKGEVIVKIKYDSFVGNMEITVQDTGEGMNQEEIDKLFQSFSRADSGKKNWSEGSGLGLYIAKKFIEMHHGTIHAESQGKGQGSQFIIELPISQPSSS